MDKEEIIEGNKLITEFMGVKSVINSENKKVYWFENPEKGFLESQLKYDSSWDWLIPVVEKIESLNYSTAINYKFGIDLSYQIVICQGDYFEFIQQAKEKITAVYKGVIEFIKWYNTQSK